MKAVAIEQISSRSQKYPEISTNIIPLFGWVPPRIQEKKEREIIINITTLKKKL